MKYTQIITIPTDNGLSIPILLVKGNISVLSLTYVRELQLIGKSISTINKILQSIAYMWDFYFTYEELFNNKTSSYQHSILKLFAEKRLSGTFDKDGLDNTLLFWKPIKLNTVKVDITNISEYTLFLKNNFNAINLNPLETKFKNDMEFIIKKEIENKFSFFNHIKKKEKSIKVKSFSRNDNFGKHTKTEYKAFPKDKINDLIKISNLREKLIYLLLAYGGCRSSEILHIYLNDVSYNENNGMANITLSNPVEGHIEWVKNGLNKTGTRRQYLFEKFNLIPRNLINGKLFSGWKSMTEDDGYKHISFVYWSNPDIGKLFYKLHLEYMKLRLTTGDNHPYYFISLSKNEYGNPLTLNALQDKFKQNVKKIELNTKQSGVNIHGLRHFYGYYCANILQVSKEMTQRMLHHRSISSTEVYYKKTLEVLEEELDKGYTKMKELKNV